LTLASVEKQADYANEKLAKLTTTDHTDHR
jgi:hypothetical protein